MGSDAVLSDYGVTSRKRDAFGAHHSRARRPAVCRGQLPVYFPAIPPMSPPTELSMPD